MEILVKTLIVVKLLSVAKYKNVVIINMKSKKIFKVIVAKICLVQRNTNVQWK